uniref:Uncharacterized protein n=1 Tax=Acrobeloides nanus TaxID=290746 RepID=A0A914ENP1_9BILA
MIASEVALNKTVESQAFEKFVVEVVKYIDMMEAGTEKVIEISAIRDTYKILIHSLERNIARADQQALAVVARPAQNQPHPASVAPQVSSMKFKPLELKQIRDWKEFWSIFEHAIDKNPNLSDTEKLIHLKQLMDGDAKDLLKDYPTNDCNYSVCKDVLKRRYENQTTLVNALYMDLEQLPKAGNDTPSQRSTLKKINRLVRQLDNENEDIDQHNILFRVSSHDQKNPGGQRAKGKQLEYEVLT